MRCAISSLLLAAACGGPSHGSSLPPAPPAAAGSANPGAAAAPSPPNPADAAFLRDFVATRGFTLGAATGARLTPDGSLVVFAMAKPRDPTLALYTFDVATGDTRELANPDKLLAGENEKLSKEEQARRERQRVKLLGFTSFEIARDGKHLLAMLSGRVFKIALPGGAVTQLAGPDAGGAAPFDARLSPDGAKLGFVRGGELWVAPASGNAAGTPVQVTRGAGGDIQHATAEFVAQEEMGRSHGWWWSPDGTQVVYQESNAAGVEKLYLSDPINPFEPTTPAAYPRPGRANVEVRLGITAAAGGGKTTWIDWDRRKFPYLARVRWDDKAPLTIVVMSRDQRDLVLLAVDTKTGKTRELVREHDDVFLNLSNEYEWLDDGSGFLWASERGGAWQLELRAPDGRLVRALTTPELGFRELLWVDPRGASAIVTAGAEPVDGLIWRVPITGSGEPERLSEASVVTDAVYARRVPVSVVTRTHEAKRLPLEVLRADGSSAGALPDTAEKPPVAPRLQVLRVGPGRGLWGSIVRPTAFEPGRKYPVLVNVYGGPHGRMVTRNQRAYVLQQWIADHGYIVVSIDNRGTPGRGRDFERAIYGKFADVPLADQVEGLKAMGALEPAMDLERVGIWGSSFGGYMSALAVLRRPDVFKAGIAIAPVSDWLDYDTCYTERYLGVPDLKDTAAYDANGLIAYAAELSRPLLIMHGTADDNVHFSHAVGLADALLRAGKPFDFVPLARQTHSPKEPELLTRYYERIFGFFSQHLGTVLPN